MVASGLPPTFSENTNVFANYAHINSLLRCFSPVFSSHLCPKYYFFFYFLLHSPVPRWVLSQMLPLKRTAPNSWIWIHIFSVCRQIMCISVRVSYCITASPPFLPFPPISRAHGAEKVADTKHTPPLAMQRVQEHQFFISEKMLPVFPRPPTK